MAIDEQVEGQEEKQSSDWFRIWFPSYGIAVRMGVKDFRGFNQLEIQMTEEDTERLGHILLEAARLSRGRKDPEIAKEILEAHHKNSLILRPKDPKK